MRLTRIEIFKPCSVVISISKLLKPDAFENSKIVVQFTHLFFCLEVWCDSIELLQDTVRTFYHPPAAGVGKNTGIASSTHSDFILVLKNVFVEVYRALFDSLVLTETKVYRLVDDKQISAGLKMSKGYSISPTTPFISSVSFIKKEIVQS